MNGGAAYLTGSSFPTLSHWGNNTPMVVEDYVSVDAYKVDTQIESGDYFMKLATTLEVLSQRPTSQPAGLTDELEKIANELLYLQHYYEVVKKTPPTTAVE